MQCALDLPFPLTMVFVLNRFLLLFCHSVSGRAIRCPAFTVWNSLITNTLSSLNVLRSKLEILGLFLTDSIIVIHTSTSNVFDILAHYEPDYYQYYSINSNKI